MPKAVGRFNVQRPPKLDTQWFDSRASSTSPAETPGFCTVHHNPPPTKTRFTTEEKVVVFGFLRWLNPLTGEWTGEWPYQVYAELGLVDAETGETVDRATVAVGRGVGEAWYSFGPQEEGIYRYYLFFRGDDWYLPARAEGQIEISAKPWWEQWWEEAKEMAPWVGLGLLGVGIAAGAAALYLYRPTPVIVVGRP